MNTDALDPGLIGRLKGHAEYIRYEAGEQLYSDLQKAIRAVDTVLRAQVNGWQPNWLTIESAPKDGTEILGWREDAGVMRIRFTSCDAFCTPDELEDMGEETAFVQDWFYADFVQGGRLEGDESPTHWTHLPAGPSPNSFDPVCAAEGRTYLLHVSPDHTVWHEGTKKDCTKCGPASPTPKHR